VGDARGRDSDGFGWSLSQRRALIVLLVVFLLVLCVRLAMDRQYVPDPQPPRGVRSAEVADRIDPNTADWQALAAIPSLGEKRAREIVAYRDHVHATDPTTIAFRLPADLRHVRGIGPATVENLQPYLVFPTARPNEKD